jgi:hypothetical protein
VKAVWKYPLAPVGLQYVAMPDGAVIRNVAVQEGAPTMWVEVDPLRPVVARGFRTVGTGAQEIERDDTYVGTAHIVGLGLVFHIYECTAT